MSTITSHKPRTRANFSHPTLYKQFVTENISIDDEYDKELEEPSIKSLAEALRI